MTDLMENTGRRSLSRPQGSEDVPCGNSPPQPGWPPFLLKLAIAVFAMGVVVWIMAGPDAGWLSMRAAGRAAQPTGIVLAGAATYFAALALLGFRVADFSRKGVE